MIIIENEITDGDRRNLLKEILFELSKSEQLLKTDEARIGYYKRFKNIYLKKDGTASRHYYSDLFQIVYQIDDESFSGNVTVLLQNISILIDNYEFSKVFFVSDEREYRRSYNASKNFLKSLNKLYDYISLEIGRMNYSKQQSTNMRVKLKATLDSAKMLNDSFSNKHEDLEKRLQENCKDMELIKEDMHKQQKNMQQEYVTILGIFATIMLAFVGGLTFSTSVFKYIGEASAHRIIVTTCLVGMTTFDIIWLLTFFIYKIAINRDNKVNIVLYIAAGIFNSVFLIGIIATLINYFCF